MNSLDAKLRASTDQAMAGWREQFRKLTPENLVGLREEMVRRYGLAELRNDEVGMTIHQLGFCCYSELVLQVTEETDVVDSNMRARDFAVGHSSSSNRSLTATLAVIVVWLWLLGFWVYKLDKRI